MSFFKKLFGGGGGDGQSAAAAGKSVEHNGFTIRAEPFKSEGQYQTAGVIEKEIGGERKEHKFIRAERHASFDAAIDFSLLKGRQIVDQQGETIFK
jgi:hypothetical protein